MEPKKVGVVCNEHSAVGMALGKYLTVRQAECRSLGGIDGIDPAKLQCARDCVREMFIKLETDARHRLCAPALELCRQRAEFVLT